MGTVTSPLPGRPTMHPDVTTAIARQIAAERRGAAVAAARRRPVPRPRVRRPAWGLVVRAVR